MTRSHGLIEPQASGRKVTAVRYEATERHALDVELYPVAELRRRVGDADARGLERIDFHCLLYLTAGRYAHVVDFERHALTPGSLLFLQPGQVHRFGDLTGCDGWLLLFRAALLSPEAMRATSTGTSKAVDELELTWLAERQRPHLRPSPATRRVLTEAIERMADDAGRPASRALNRLLRSQVQSLLIRLQLDDAPAAADERIEPAALQRYHRFRSAVERDFTRWHQLAPYAAFLGCSEKSLTRAALEITDRSAKAVISERLVLEAKRLLAHTLSPVAAIGDQLGFAEATNFVKFFRREVGLTPGAFRAEQRRQGVGSAGP
jgi:AraC-like DNA-binding protein